jgi:hypothetical protein
LQQFVHGFLEKMENQAGHVATVISYQLQVLESMARSMRRAVCVSAVFESIRDDNINVYQWRAQILA